MTMFRTAKFRAAFARSLGIALAAILAAPLACAQLAWAQDPPPVRIRGTVERVDGPICVVKARDGAN
jgi:ABC-type spermidine/putrescine transport system permease subunit II